MKREYEESNFYLWIQAHKSTLTAFILTLFAAILFSSIIVFAGSKRVENYNFKEVLTGITSLVGIGLVSTCFLHKFSFKRGLRFLLMNVTYLSLITVFFSRISYTSINLFNLSIPLYAGAMAILLISYWFLTKESLEEKKLGQTVTNTTAFISILSVASLFQILRALPASETFVIQNPLLQLIFGKVNPFFWLLICGGFLAAIKTEFAKKTAAQRLAVNLLINLQILISIYILSITTFAQNYTQYWILTLIAYIIWHGFYTASNKYNNDYAKKQIVKEVFTYHLLLLTITIFTAIFILN